MNSCGIKHIGSKTYCSEEAISILHLQQCERP
nr:MAG TPA: hypothetical protein [Caudoviricetes sp.]